MRDIAWMQRATPETVSARFVEWFLGPGANFWLQQSKFKNRPSEDDTWRNPVAMMHGWERLRFSRSFLTPASFEQHVGSKNIHNEMAEFAFEIELRSIRDDTKVLINTVELPVQFDNSISQIYPKGTWGCC